MEAITFEISNETPLIFNVSFNVLVSTAQMKLHHRTAKSEKVSHYERLGF